MSEIIRLTFTIYRSYGGESMMTLLAAAAVLYLWIVEEKRELKGLFVYLMVGIIGLFFFPVFSYVAMHYFLDEQIYYRLLWLMPIGIVVCYSAVKVISQIDKPYKRVLVGIVMLAFIALSGSLVYQNPMVKRAENLYHLPKEDIAVADVMHVDGREVKAVVPDEMLQFIRQYDASILLAYGRDALVDGWGNNPLYEAMNTNPVRSFAITDYAKQQGVEYIVLRAGTPIVGTKPIEKYEFSYLTTIENYDIYIYDKAEFVEEKKKEYASGLNESHGENYTQTE